MYTWRPLPLAVRRSEWPETSPRFNCWAGENNFWLRVQAVYLLTLSLPLRLGVPLEDTFCQVSKPLMTVHFLLIVLYLACLNRELANGRKTRSAQTGEPRS